MNGIPAVVTGATGCLGSQLVLEMLQSTDCPIVCLARGDAAHTAEWRVVRAVEVAARTSGVLLTPALIRRIVVVDGSPLEEPPSVLDVTGLAGSPPPVFWHCAASVSFVERVPGELYRVNVDGLMHALGWASRFGCSTFHHVSTAFVAGRRTGPVDEEMSDEAPDFVNAYEASKFEGERRVRRHCDAAGMAWRIFRPSIIVGHSRTSLSGSNSGLYRYVQMVSEFWSEAASREGGNPAPLRIWLPPFAASNVVPVDLCAREMLAVGRNPASGGGVFHLVGRRDVQCRWLFEALAELTPMLIEVTDDAGSLCSHDLALAEGLAHYAPYLTTRKQFSRAATLAGAGEDLQADLQYDAPMLHRLVEAAVARLDREKKPSHHAKLFVWQRGLDDGFNLVGALLAQAEARGLCGVAISDVQRDMSYAALPGSVRRVAGTLNRIGLHAEQHLAVIALDGVPSALVMLGAIYLGAVVVRINPLMPLHQIRQFLSSSVVQLVLADDAIADALQDAAYAGRVERIAGLFKDGRGDPAASPDLAEDAWLPAVTSAHDPAIGVFTSGSTGQPQLVLHPHFTPLVAAERYGAQVLDIKPSDVLFSASRLSFAFGLQNLFLALLHGARSVLAPERVSAESFTAAIRRFRPSIVFAVPTVYQMVLDAGLTQVELDVTQVRAVVSAGEPLPVALAARWRRTFGLPILDSLGSTEVFSTYLSNLIGSEANGSTGRLMPGFEACLRDESGGTVAEGAAGVMWIRGPSVITGYSASGTRGAFLFRDGWFCTQDVFRRDADDSFYFCGRAGDMFKVSGQWASPVEIEAVLREHPRVREAAVVASGEESGVLRLKAYVVPSHGPVEGLAEELRRDCSKALGRAKQPHSVEFMRELPRTLNGKLRRLDLRSAGASLADARSGG